MNDKIKNLIENLKTQDNRITNLPIFYVQEKERIWGLDGSNYGDGYQWIDAFELEEINDKELTQKLDEAEDNLFCYSERWTHELLANYRKVWYKDQWVNAQPFFTEVAAKRYIEINGHNLKSPRIYVESGYRNEEWELIREYFLNLKEEN